MEERGWVLKLPVGADSVHTRAKVESGPKKQVEPKPSSSKTPQQGKRNLAKKAKQGTVSTGVLRSHPILRDIINDSK